MNRFAVLIIAICGLAALCCDGCRSKNAAAPPPTDVAVTPQPQTVPLAPSAEPIPKTGDISLHWEDKNGTFFDVALHNDEVLNIYYGNYLEQNGATISSFHNSRDEVTAESGKEMNPRYDQVKTGMSSDEVVKLLGKPTHVTTLPTLYYK